MRTDKKSVVKIGYKDFDIIFINKIDKGKSIGECVLPSSEHKLSKGKIRIAKGQDGIEKANTILHEILHAICYVKGLELTDKLEERIVCAITNGIVGFIKDNPKYALKLFKLIKK